MSQWELSAQGQMTLSVLRHLSYHVALHLQVWKACEQRERVTAGWKWEWQQDLSVSHAKYETHLHTLANGFPRFTPSLLLFLLTSLTCLEWVQMCDPQTLPLWSPYWTHRAQQRLADSLKSSWPKCHCTQSHHLQAIVLRGIEVLQLNKGHFIIQSDVVDHNKAIWWFV